MELALDILDRALRSEPAAISVLERTASIYVLNASCRSAPQTYGCWDFLSQALNEIERYEAASRFNRHPEVGFENHVQLLCMMSCKAARRSPESDRRLIGICLRNSGQYYVSFEDSQMLINKNTHMREQVMGRVAATAFDFSFHRIPEKPIPIRPLSAFSNLVAMEGLCKIVAANSVSSGPEAIREIVLGWIVPSFRNLPPFAVAAVILHLANEAMGKSAPCGTKEILGCLKHEVFPNILYPLLEDSLRDSEVEQVRNTSGLVDNKNICSLITSQRLVVITLKALERWSLLLDLSLIQFNTFQVAKKVNMVDLINDSLYSNENAILDAVAELLETVLQLRHRENVISQEEALKHEILLLSLSSAIGMQFFRFDTKGPIDDYNSCQCLTKVACIVAAAAFKIKGTSQNIDDVCGLIDLLLKASSHRSFHVCELALGCIPILLCSESEICARVLPILHQKAIFPDILISSPYQSVSSHRENNIVSTQSDDVDFEKFERFRENVLSQALNACYLANRSYYMESCAAAVENLCSTSPTSLVVYQLEAVLFCLGTVSANTTNRASLVKLSTTSQEAARKTISSSKHVYIKESIDTLDVVNHDEQLARCAFALSKATSCASNPFVSAQICRFVGKYSDWFAVSNMKGVLDAGAELAFISFKLACDAFRGDNIAQDMIREMKISPFAEAVAALRNILKLSISNFNTPALAALAGAWEISYSPTNGGEMKVSIKDREALCGAICHILTALPADQWAVSLNALARPTIDSLAMAVRKADSIVATISMENQDDSICSVLKSFLITASEEVRILTTMTKIFNNVMESNELSVEVHRHPSLQVFKKAWPWLSILAQHYSMFDKITDTLGDFVINSIAVGKNYEGDCSILRELCDMAITMMSVVIKTNEARLIVPILKFVAKVVDRHGSEAEIDTDYLKEAMSQATTITPGNDAQVLVIRLLSVSENAVAFFTGGIWQLNKTQKNIRKP